MNDDEIAEQRAEILDGWDEAASGWGRQADRMQEAATAVSGWMIAHAALEPGMRVLELAAGPGDTGFIAAGQVEPGGILICSDAAENMLEVARERAEEQGVRNVEFRQLQLEWIDLPTADVDALLCRWGVMLAVDPEAALRECRRVLKPGGRLCIAVWDAPERNPWVTVSETAVAELGYAASPNREAPGMFALSAAAKLEELVGQAGFLEIVIEPVAITQQYSSVNDYIGQTRDLSRGFRRVWDGLGDSDRQRLRETVAELTSAYTQPDGSIRLPGGCVALSAAA